MEKKTFLWQVVTLALGLFLIFTIKNYLEDKIIVDAMKTYSETMTSRADCFANVGAKNLNDAYCKNIDSTAYRLFEKYKFITP